MNPMPPKGEQAAATARKEKPKEPTGKKLAAGPTGLTKVKGFLQEETHPDDLRFDESDFLVKHNRILTVLFQQAAIILALVALIGIAMPFNKPLYTYVARYPVEGKPPIPLTPMDEPIMTDPALLAWVATSITEILTFGFGDFDKQILSQRQRFTSEGWESFTKEVRQRELRTLIKAGQLVLTTAPAEAPVIVAKGRDMDRKETWTIEMPVIMTYATNNNVRQTDRKIVRLVIARVPSTKSKYGVGIKSWHSM